MCLAISRGHDDWTKAVMVSVFEGNDSKFECKNDRATVYSVYLEEC